MFWGGALIGYDSYASSTGLDLFSEETSTELCVHISFFATCLSSRNTSWSSVMPFTRGFSQCISPSLWVATLWCPFRVCVAKPFHAPEEVFQPCTTMRFVTWSRFCWQRYVPTLPLNSSFSIWVVKFSAVVRPTGTMELVLISLFTAFVLLEGREPS